MRATYWHLCIASVSALVLAVIPLASQQRSIIRSNGTATVSVDDPRPLGQAIIAIRQEYGWVVDYEEPPWESNRDLRDISPAAWHAAHPGMRGGVVPAGGAFQSSYAESPDMWISGPRELAVLDKIVSDYDASGNPGKFVVRAQSDGSYAVVAVSAGDNRENQVSVRPYLDTAVSIPEGTRNADTTIDLILSAVSLKTGIVGRQGGLDSFNLTHRSMITLGGTDEPARDLLIQVARAMPSKMVWDLWFLPDLQKYALRFHAVTLVVPGAFGQRRLVPIGPAPAPGP